MAKGSSRNISSRSVSDKQKADAIQQYVDQNAVIQTAISKDYADGRFDDFTDEEIKNAKKLVQALDGSFEPAEEDIVLYSGTPSIREHMLGKKLKKQLIDGGSLYVNEETAELEAFNRDANERDLEYTDKFFHTTTKSFGIARSYAGIDEADIGDETKGVFRIHVPKGTPMIDTSSKRVRNMGVKSHDGDIILPRGTRFRVSKEIGTKDGVAVFDLYVVSTKMKK